MFCTAFNQCSKFQEVWCSLKSGDCQSMEGFSKLHETCKHFFACEVYGVNFLIAHR